MDFLVLAYQLFPTFLRRPRHRAWFLALMAPLQSLWNTRIVGFIQATRLEVTRNSQVLIFEKTLNDIYDAGLRRIRIIHRDFEVFPVWFRSEGQPATFVGFRSEGLTDYFVGFRVENTAPQGATDFTVEVPTPYANFEDQIRATIETYRIVPKTYQIVYI